MAFAPVLPMSGIAGWSLLSRVEGDQRAAFERSPTIARDAERFSARIAEAGRAQDLVSDRSLLRVALTAFGLEGEIDKRAFLRAVLESDATDRESFANRLVDKRYRDFANAFGYGSVLGPRVAEPGFATEILQAYKARAFEAAVGESDPAMRLALNARRELAEYAASSDPDGAAWYSAMGDRPVRRVLEQGLGLPESFAQLDVDRQQAELRRRTAAAFGDSSMAVFSNPDNVETLIRRFLARDAADQGPNGLTPGAVAVSLLAQGGAGLGNLVQSRFA